MAHSDGLRRADDKLQRRDPGAGGMICHDRNRTGSPMATIGRAASQKGGRKVLSGWKQHFKTAAPRATTRRKMFGRTAITSRPTPHQMGGHHAKPRPHRAGTRSATRGKTSGRFFDKLRHAPPTSHGGYQRADPSSRVGKTGAAQWEIAAPTTSQ